MMTRLSLVIIGMLVAACAIVAPYQPPDGTQFYWGKDTAVVMPPQSKPILRTLGLIFVEVEWWENNPYPFRSVWFSPLTIWSCPYIGCLHVYDGVKIDATYTEEGWTIYSVPPNRYVYELRGFKPDDDHSEQFALGWHQQSEPCDWRVMARC